MAAVSLLESTLLDLQKHLLIVLFFCPKVSSYTTVIVCLRSLRNFKHFREKSEAATDGNEKLKANYFDRKNDSDAHLIFLRFLIIAIGK